MYVIFSPRLLLCVDLRVFCVFVYKREAQTVPSGYVRLEGEFSVRRGQACMRVGAIVGIFAATVDGGGGRVGGAHCNCAQMCNAACIVYDIIVRA